MSERQNQISFLYNSFQIFFIIVFTIFCVTHDSHGPSYFNIGGQVNYNSVTILIYKFSDLFIQTFGKFKYCTLSIFTINPILYFIGIKKFRSVYLLILLCFVSSLYSLSIMNGNNGILSIVLANLIIKTGITSKLLNIFFIVILSAFFIFNEIIERNKKMKKFFLNKMQFRISNITYILKDKFQRLYFKIKVFFREKEEFDDVNFDLQREEKFAFAGENNFLTESRENINIDSSIFQNHVHQERRNKIYSPYNQKSNKVKKNDTSTKDDKQPLGPKKIFSNESNQKLYETLFAKKCVSFDNRIIKENFDKKFIGKPDSQVRDDDCRDASDQEEENIIDDYHDRDELLAGIKANCEKIQGINTNVLFNENKSIHIDRVMFESFEKNEEDDLSNIKKHGLLNDSRNEIFSNENNLQSQCHIGLDKWQSGGARESMLVGQNSSDSILKKSTEGIYSFERPYISSSNLLQPEVDFDNVDLDYDMKIAALAKESVNDLIKSPSNLIARNTQAIHNFQAIIKPIISNNAMQPNINPEATHDNILDSKESKMNIFNKPSANHYTNLDNNNVQKAIIKEHTVQVKIDYSKFRLPDINFLTSNYGKKVVANHHQAQLTADKLIKVLKDFSVFGKIISYHIGPVITLYEFEPLPGTKSSRVIGLCDDIARSLSATSARISVISGKNALGIELPNDQREIVLLKDIISSDQYLDQSYQLPIALGKNISGEPIVVDLAKMPHLLVAGTTGSGKSVAINTMIISILYSMRPNQCKFIMIDPKMLELSVYNGIPHLLTPVVTDPKKAVVVLKWVVKEMEERYRMMSYLGVRNIKGYNEKIEEAIAEEIELKKEINIGLNKETGDPITEVILIERKLFSYIIVIVDEMADLMLVAGKEIEFYIQRLAQMARAAGIHIIMATQRPSVDVITGVIKANLPTRISFAVTSKIDSRTILGEQGAEQLLGMGDMLYMASGNKIVRIHGPFVSDNEVEKIVNYLKSFGPPEYLEAITTQISSSINLEEQEETEDSSDEDSDYQRAVDLVMKEKKVSISYIQRQLRIGYNKSANIVDRMEREGIISVPNHQGKRELIE